MGSLERRLSALEDRRDQQARDGDGLSREALSRLSDEDLDALEEVIEDALERGMETATFENLYAVASEKSRRALDAYLEAFEAAREGREREPPGHPPEALPEEKNAYRIWQYRK